MQDGVRLQRHSSVSATDSAFGIKGQHEFTVIRNGTRWTCLSYRHNDAEPGYYAAFREGQLDRVIVPPPFEYEVLRVDGANCEKRKAWATDGRVEAVLASKNLLEQGFVEPRCRGGGESAGHSNLAGGILLLAPSLLLGRVSDAACEERRRELLRRFDPFHVPLGTTRSSVWRAFGKPERTVAVGEDSSVDVFGYDPSPRYKCIVDYPRVAVEFRADHVVAVFSGDFFNEDLLLPLQDGHSHGQAMR